MNHLYYGDNIDILRNYIKTETVDLIYLDPPFQSGKNYNQIFTPQAGGIKGATAQIQAFEDTWQWGPEAESEYTGLITGTLTTEQPPGQKLIDLMKAMRGYLGECPLMAYLCMMAPRLVEMRRVLKNTGSIYLHCDPTASHYLKLLMDATLGAKNFQNEVIWCYSERESSKKRWNTKHDVILFYTKQPNKQHTFNWKAVALEYSPGTTKKFNYTDEQGRPFQIRGKGGPVIGKQGLDIELEKTHPDWVYRDYYDKSPGVPPRDWFVIPIINRAAKERVGYPTQKPEALLERIIKASSNEGDLVMDPFCGCGTAVAVAEKLRRQWIGIDITYLAIDVIRKRLARNNIKEGEHFKVGGVPQDVHSAGRLAEANPGQFEVWAVAKLNATPTGKAGDQGVDGVINFIDLTRPDRIGKGVVSVKGGHSINPAMVRDLRGTVESQGAAFGILITLEPPSRGMIAEAGTAGSFSYSHHKGTVPVEIPRIQLLTAADLFNDPIPVKLPPGVLDPYRKPDIKIDRQKTLPTPPGE